MTDVIRSNVAMTDIGSVLGSLQGLKAELPAGQQAVIDELLRAARVSETTPPQYNPYLPGVHIDPYPYQRRLQLENPVHYSRTIGAWVLSRYADVGAALRDPRLSSRVALDTVMASVPVGEHDTIRTVSAFMSSGLNQLEGDEHTRMRRIMTHAMSAETMARMQPFVEQAVHELLDAVDANGAMDLVHDFARPLPVYAAAALLGIPRTDRETVAGWVEAIMNTFSDGFSGTTAMQRGEAAVPQLLDYLRDLVRERRLCPGEDVITAMLASGTEAEDDIVHIAAHFPIGMHENIRHGISVGMLSLLLAPGEVERLQADPALIPVAVEEMLRFDGVVPFLTRLTLEEIEIGGVTIRKGQRVVLLLAAANRDPSKFAEPHRFDAGRRPNQHIAFGAGRHACTGASLTRSIWGAAVRALLTRLPGLRLGAIGPTWCEEFNIRGLESLPVRFEARRAVA